MLLGRRILIWFELLLFLISVIAFGEENPKPVSMRLEQERVSPREQIVLHLSGDFSGLKSDAWVGIVTPETPHGDAAKNLAETQGYQYVSSSSGRLYLFIAPETPGTYEIRLFDSKTDGSEIAALTFQVKQTTGSRGPSLRLEKTVFAANETAKVWVTTPAGFPEDAWIALVPADTAHGEAATNMDFSQSILELQGMVSGYLSFRAPGESGRYEFRLHESWEGREAFSIGFEVQ